MNFAPEYKLREGTAAWSSAVELKEIHLDTKQNVPLETGSTCNDSYLTAAALGNKVRPKNCKEKNWTKGDKPKNTLQPLKQSFDCIDLNEILLTWKNHMEENVKLRKCPVLKSHSAALLQDLRGFCEEHLGGTSAGFNESWRRIINNSYANFACRF